MIRSVWTKSNLAIRHEDMHT